MGLENKRIIVIDDTAAIRTFLRISLEAQGVRFFEAATAATGIKLCQELQPDIVVLDLGLPDRDGMEILPDIKLSRQNTDTSPAIVVLTVRKEQQVRDRAMAMGADAYLTKPFVMDDLLDIIREKSAVI